jgi:hypothetical protein
MVFAKHQSLLSPMRGLAIFGCLCPVKHAIIAADMGDPQVMVAKMPP